VEQDHLRLFARWALREQIDAVSCIDNVKNDTLRFYDELVSLCVRYHPCFEPGRHTHTHQDKR
jgi:hypothetical protein